MGFLATILGLVDPISKIASKIAEYKIAAQNATTERARITAEENIKALEQQISLAVAASQNDKWWSTRELIGKCALLYVFKIVVWDTVLKLGITPDPGPHVTGIVMLVLGFYYGSKPVTDIATRMLGMVRR